VGNGHREPVNARARKTAAATSAGSSRLRAGSGGGTGQVSLDTADVVRDVSERTSGFALTLFASLRSAACLRQDCGVGAELSAYHVLVFKRRRSLRSLLGTSAA
jgi:hypothetical protein